jgi:hypothetical protein
MIAPMARLLAICVVALLLTAGCPGGSGNGSSGGGGSLPDVLLGPDGGSADPDGTPATLTVSGTVSYERLPVTATGFDAPVVEPARGILVEVVAHDTLDTVLFSTFTDNTGSYSFLTTTPQDFYVRARAQSFTGPDIDRVLHSGTDPLLVHGVSSPIVNRAAGDQTVDLLATHNLPHARGGAFAALDTVQRLRESVSASFPNFGPVDVFWSVGNQGADFQGSAFATGSGLNGPLGNPSIFLVGGTQADPTTTDHDQYDETVIAHEWSHLLMFTQSRDNNFGGPHAGEQLIPSAAWGEGVVNAIGCGLLHLPVYRDTVGYPPGASSVQFEFDLETGLLPGTGTGYHNEFVVSRVVWDILDGGAGWPADQDGDPVAVDKDDFFASLAALRTRGPPFEVAWLASFLQQLIDDSHMTVNDADDLMAPYGESFPPAGGDPFPELLVLGAPAVSGSVDAFDGADPNPNPVLGVQANAVYRLELATAQTVTLTLTATAAGYDAAAHRLVLSVYDLERNRIAHDDGDGDTKVLAPSLQAGTYIVRVRHSPGSESLSQESSFLLEAQ